MKFFLILLLLPLASFAASKRTGASSMDSDNFLGCVDQSVNGRVDGECAGKGDALECIGMRRALEYSAKRSRCMTQENLTDCPLYGHKQFSEQDWMSAAAGHLASFQRCVKLRYGEDANSSTEFTAEAALNDASFLALIRALDDGSSAFELKKSDVLERVLRGERLPKIITESPFIKKNIGPKEQEAYRIGADTPMKFKSKITQMNGPYEYGSNPASEGIGLDKIARENYLAAAGITGSVSFGVQAGPEAAGPKVSEMPTDQAMAQSQRSPAANPNVHIKDLKVNPYSLGLDRNIFDRVSLTYQKHFRELQSVDVYIDRSPKKIKTLEDTIARGAAIEL